jgi:hypothetical protein
VISGLDSQFLTAKLRKIILRWIISAVGAGFDDGVRESKYRGLSTALREEAAQLRSR